MSINLQYGDTVSSYLQSSTMSFHFFAELGNNDVIDHFLTYTPEVINDRNEVRIYDYVII